MSAVLDKLVTFLLLHGYDVFMMLMVCCQTLIAAVALWPKKMARVYPLRLVRGRGRAT